jgi:HAD superfamily hydrolase (TIGR01509 family)
MIRAVFWDNDGVLVDTEKIYYQATAELLRTTGVELTEVLFRRVSLVEGRSSFILAAERGIPQEEIDRLHAERNRRYTELLEGGVRIMEGVEEALAALKGQVVQGIVTSSRKEHFDTMHRGTGLLPNFDFILTREDFTLSKPDPEPYRKAMERCRLTPDECVVVEDSPRGLESAVAAGIRCLVIPNALTLGDAFHGAWRILASSREVPGELRRIDGAGRTSPPQAAADKEHMHGDH